MFAPTALKPYVFFAFFTRTMFMFHFASVSCAFMLLLTFRLSFVHASTLQESSQVYHRGGFGGVKIFCFCLVCFHVVAHVSTFFCSRVYSSGVISGVSQGGFGGGQDILLLSGVLSCCCSRFDFLLFTRLLFRSHLGCITGGFWGGSRYFVSVSCAFMLLLTLRLSFVHASTLQESSWVYHRGVLYTSALKATETHEI